MTPDFFSSEAVLSLHHDAGDALENADRTALLLGLCSLLKEEVFWSPSWGIDDALSRRIDIESLVSRTRWSIYYRDGRWGILASSSVRHEPAEIILETWSGVVWAWNASANGWTLEGLSDEEMSFFLLTQLQSAETGKIEVVTPWASRTHVMQEAPEVFVSACLAHGSWPTAHSYETALQLFTLGNSDRRLLNASEVFISGGQGRDHLVEGSYAYLAVQALKEISMLTQWELHTDACCSDCLIAPVAPETKYVAVTWGEQAPLAWHPNGSARVLLQIFPPANESFAVVSEVAASFDLPHSPQSGLGIELGGPPPLSL